MYTLESLLDIAKEAEAEFRELSEQVPFNIVDYRKTNARKNMEDAFTCAAWLEKSGLVGISNIGSFTSSELTPGQKVVIKKESLIKSTNPDYASKFWVLKEDQVVTPHNVYNGYVYVDIIEGTVQWVGSGGYYNWTYLENIEIG